MMQITKNLHHYSLMSPFFLLSSQDRKTHFSKEMLASFKKNYTNFGNLYTTGPKDFFVKK